MAVCKKVIDSTKRITKKNAPARAAPKTKEWLKKITEEDGEEDSDDEEDTVEKEKLKNEMLLSNSETDPLFVADIVFRQQLKWLLSKRLISDNCHDVARNLWMRYLTLALPDPSIGRAFLVWNNHGVKGGEKGEKAEKDQMFCRKRHKLSFNTLIAIIALAMNICNERTLMSDLILWIRLGLFPYPLSEPLESAKQLSALEILLPEADDDQLPSFDAVAREMSIVQDFLWNSEPPNEPGYALNLLPIIDRFVEELNLPLGISSIAGRTAKRLQIAEFPVAPRNFEFLSCESVVMILIVDAMMLLFGMDDDCERRLDEQTAKLQEIFPHVPFFNLTDWIHYIDLRRTILFKNTRLLPTSSALATLHCHVRTQKLFTDQNSAQISDELTNDPQPESPLDLSPNHRPFRSYSAHYSSNHSFLKKDFSEHTIEHLTEDSLCALLSRLNADKDEAISGKFPEIVKEVSAIRSSVSSGRYPLRAHQFRSKPLQPDLDYIPSASLRWLFEICSECIGQQPEELLGQFMMMELKFHPNNYYCVLARRRPTTRKSKKTPAEKAQKKRGEKKRQRGVDEEKLLDSDSSSENDKEVADFNMASEPVAENEGELLETDSSSEE